MTKLGYTAHLYTADGRTVALFPKAKGQFFAAEGTAHLHAERIGDVSVFYASGALKEEEDRLSGDCALCVHFPDRPAVFVAQTMRGEFWSEPSFGHRFSEVPPRTQAILWQEEHMWRLMWALCGKQYNCVFEGEKQGLSMQLYSCVDSLREVPETACFLYAAGKDPYTLLRRAAKAATKLTDISVRTVAEKPFSALFDHLGWCSWDALQIRVNEAGLLAKAEEFAEKGIPVRWCIIDDMWGHVKGLNDVPATLPFLDMVRAMHKSTLYAMEADPQRFPHGLSGCIDALHEKGLAVGVWYPTTGYWAGVDPAGPLAKEMAEDLTATPSGKLVVKPTPDSAKRFHGAMQTMLKQAGADFVKVDNQSHYRKTYRGHTPVGEAAGAIQGAIEEVTRVHFGDRLINCMGMSGESMWKRAYSAVSRCSNDFLPENPAWFTKHVMQCSYNSLFQGQFYYSDWDMWWTDDGQALKNSVCRAISGGPVYVSDPIGRSRPEILRPLCFSDGKLLRADGQAVPTEDCLTADPRKGGKPLKIRNRVGRCGVLALFDLQEDDAPVRGEIASADLQLPEGDYLVREQITGENFLLKKGETYSLTLRDKSDFRLYLFVPLAGETVAVGLLDKFLSPGAILSADGKGLRLYEGGLLGLWGRSLIATNRRPQVRGERAGELYVFPLEKDETEIIYL